MNTSFHEHISDVPLAARIQYFYDYINAIKNSTLAINPDIEKLIEEFEIVFEDTIYKD